jgi:hypothetical protein
MAIWKTYRIVDIITEIGEDKFVLPVIQRPLVWGEDKMELLFDTLLKGDSFGGIMVIEEEKNTKPLFNYRPFTRDGDLIASRQVDNLTQLQNFVIDGQQRLQTFYIGLKGSINGKVLYFDLYGDFNTEFEFKFENDTQKLSKQSKENEDRKIPTHNWYLASGLFNRLKDTNDEDQVASEIIAAQNVTDSLKITHITKNVKAFYKNVLTAETLGISRVVINKTFNETINRQRIVELFRRLNDGGTKLSAFDLVASILKGFAWEMEGFLRDTLESYEEIGLSQDNLIKLIFILQNNHKKEMASIDGGDADFAIQNRERIKSTLKSLKDFLIHSKLYDYYKDGNRSFIPLFFLAYHIYHKKIDNNAVIKFFDNFDAGNTEFPKMKEWLYHSLVNGVFRSKGAGWIPYKTGIRKLLDEIKRHNNSDFPINELFQVYIDHPITFTIQYNSSNLDQLDSSFLYYLMYDQAKPIRIQDIDHIMPKSILEGLGYDLSKINSIKNFQLIDYGTNRGEKNGKAFAEWINNPAYVSDKSAFIRLHLIPIDESIWTEDKFEEFIEARAILILNKLTKFTTSFSENIIELNKISDSPTNSNIKTFVSKPKETNSSSIVTEVKQLQFEFWQGLKDFMEINNSFVKMRNPLHESWADFSIGKSDIYISASIDSRKKLLKIWLIIRGEQAKNNYDKLYDLSYDNSLIEVNNELVWDRMEGHKMSTVILKSNADITNKSDWVNQFNWFAINLEKFVKYFKPLMIKI